MRTMLLAAAWLGLLGCPPPRPFELAGAVGETTCTSSSYTPVEGATATLRCGPSGATFAVARSDEGGHLRQRLPGPTPLDCVLQIEHEGYLARSYTIGEICADKLYPTDRYCRWVGVTAELQRVEAPQP